MWLCILLGRPFEETSENTQWRKVKQMQPMWLCIVWDKRLEEAYENTQWRKAKQMQPMWLCIPLCRPFEETSENTQWRKVKQMRPMWLHPLRQAIWGSQPDNLKTEKSDKYSPCNFFLLLPLPPICILCGFAHSARSDQFSSSQHFSTSTSVSFFNLFKWERPVTWLCHTGWFLTAPIWVPASSSQLIRIRVTL